MQSLPFLPQNDYGIVRTPEPGEAAMEWAMRAGIVLVIFLAIRGLTK